MVLPADSHPADLVAVQPQASNPSLPGHFAYFKDILPKIFEGLTLKDIATLRQSCKGFRYNIDNHAFPVSPFLNFRVLKTANPSNTLVVDNQFGDTDILDLNQELVGQHDDLKFYSVLDCAVHVVQNNVLIYRINEVLPRKGEFCVFYSGNNTLSILDSFGGVSKFNLSDGKRINCERVNINNKSLIRRSQSLKNILITETFEGLQIFDTRSLQLIKSISEIIDWKVCNNKLFVTVRLDRANILYVYEVVENKVSLIGENHTEKNESVVGVLVNSVIFRKNTTTSVIYSLYDFKKDEVLKSKLLRYTLPKTSPPYDYEEFQFFVSGPLLFILNPYTATLSVLHALSFRKISDIQLDLLTGDFRCVGYPKDYDTTHGEGRIPVIARGTEYKIESRVKRITYSNSQFTLEYSRKDEKELHKLTFKLEFDPSARLIAPKVDQTLQSVDISVVEEFPASPPKPKIPLRSKKTTRITPSDVGIIAGLALVVAAVFACLCFVPNKTDFYKSMAARNVLIISGSVFGATSIATIAFTIFRHCNRKGGESLCKSFSA